MATGDYSVTRIYQMPQHFDLYVTCLFCVTCSNLKITK